MKKEGEPGKTYHMRDVRWNQLPYMVQQQVGWLERQNFSPKFDLNITISYESASGGPSVPSLYIKNCDLHGNSIRVHALVQVGSTWAWTRIELPCKLQFSTCSEEAEASSLADS